MLSIRLHGRSCAARRHGCRTRTAPRGGLAAVRASPLPAAHPAPRGGPPRGDREPGPNLVRGNRAPEKGPQAGHAGDTGRGAGAARSYSALFFFKLKEGSAL